MTTASNGKVTKVEGAVFLRAKDGEYGTFYSGTFDGTAVNMSVAEDGRLAITANKATAYLDPHENDRGRFWIGEVVGGNRYFLSERTNDRGPYMMAKPAIDRPDYVASQAVPAAPAPKYGKRA